MGLLGMLFGKKKDTSTSKAAAPSTKSPTTPTKKRAAVSSTSVGITLRTMESLQAEFIALDFETTGLSPERDRVVEIGAVRFVGGKPSDSLSLLVNPGFPMPAEASAVNHITDRMLAKAPREERAVGQITQFLGGALEGSTILVAHNARYDISFLEQMLMRQGVTASIRYADTLGLSRSLVRGLRNYKQPTVANHFGIRNRQEHRAEADAETCGRIMVRLMDLAEEDVERERRQAENARPTPEELEVCAYIRWALAFAGYDVSNLGFYRNSSGYVDVMDVYTLLKFKFAKKGKYVVLDAKALPEGYRYTEPCTMTEGGTEYVRFFFESPYDLAPLRAHLCERHRTVKAEAKRLLDMGVDVYAEYPGQPDLQVKIGESEAQALLEAAKARPSIQERGMVPTASVAPHVERSEIEIFPRYGRQPLEKVRNKRNENRAFKEGYPLWEAGDLERRRGSIEASIAYFDRARMAGYAYPALYESYALAFRKLKAYDDEIAILDEALDRLGPDGKFEARRDKAIQLLARARRLEEERLHREEERARVAEEKAARRLDKERESRSRKEVTEMARENVALAAAKSTAEIAEAGETTKWAGSRPIVMLDDSMQAVAEFPSVAEAARSIGSSTKSIRSAAKGLQKHAAGYVWRYADELEEASTS